MKDSYESTCTQIKDLFIELRTAHRRLSAIELDSKYRIFQDNVQNVYVSRIDDGAIFNKNELSWTDHYAERSNDFVQAHGFKTIGQAYKIFTDLQRSNSEL